MRTRWAGVWDLRGFKEGCQPVASFAWHAAAITSVEWHPEQPSVIAASAADNQVVYPSTPHAPDPAHQPLNAPFALSGAKGRSVAGSVSPLSWHTITHHTVTFILRVTAPVCHLRARH